MLGYLRRLVTTGAAYQFGGHRREGACVAHAAPLHPPRQPEGYGAAESLLTAVILSSIFLRAGIGEAFIRFYYDDEDTVRRDRIARTATATVAWTTTLAAAVALAVRGPALVAAARLREPELIDCAILGLWAFTNLEMA